MAHFHLPLGLTAVGLATETCPGQAEALCSELIRAAAESEDAFAAGRSRHNAARGQMAPTESETLNTLVRRAGLVRGSIPPPLLADLLAPVESTEDVLIRALRT